MRRASTTNLVAGVLAWLAAVGCAARPDDGPAGRPDGEARPAPKRRGEADVPAGTDVASLWDLYATDAVAWRDRVRGRYVTLTLRPPWVIRESEGGFFVLQGYQNGTRAGSARVGLKDAAARRLSRIRDGAETVPKEKLLCVRAWADEEGFSFHDGEIVLLSR